MIGPTLLLVAAVQHDPAALASALDSRLGWRASCDRAPAGCRARLDAFAGYFVVAGQATGVSPWLLAAVAVEESRLNPFAEGHCGRWACRGVMQIHERWRGAPPFVRSERARDRCRRRVGACQLEVVTFGARLLAREVKRCGGVAAGLGAYNTGRCGLGQKYAARVERERADLLAAVVGSTS